MGLIFHFLLLNVELSLTVKNMPKFFIGPYGEQIIFRIFLIDDSGSLSGYFLSLILVLEKECRFFMSFSTHW